MNPMTSDIRLDSSVVSVCSPSGSLVKDPPTERMGTAMDPVTVDDCAWPFRYYAGGRCAFGRSS